MNWIRYIFVLAFLCTLTGTCFSIVWFLLRGLLERYDSRVIYRCLKIVIVFYILPIALLGVIIYYESIYYHHSLWAFYNYLLFEFTPTILFIMKTTVLVWFAEVVTVLLIQIKDAWKWYQLRRGDIPEDDETAEQLFEEICDKMQIGKRVALARNDLLVVPVLSGLLHPTVILPCIDYTPEELEIIFTHELTHYKQKDLWVKLAAVIIMMLHCLNPAAHHLLYSVTAWSEVNCDIAVCEALKSKYNTKEYYAMIVNRMIRSQRMERYLLSAMAENSHEMIRRVEQMKKYQKRKGMDKKKAAAFVTAFMALGLTVSLGIGGLTAEAHQKLYDVVKEENSVETVTEASRAVTDDTADILRTASTGVLQPDTLEEGANVIEIPVEWNPKAKNMQWDVHWYVDCNTYVKSNIVKLDAGDKVSVLMTFMPENLFMKFGLVYPDGSMWFTGGYGLVDYTFDIEEAGEYRVYMHNKNTKYFVEAKGNVVFVTDNYTPEEGGSVSGQW